MALGELPLIQLSDTQAQQAQSQQNQRINQLSKVPMLDGLLIENLSLKSGNNTVTHKLGRKIRGYQIWRQNAQSQIWDSDSAGEDKAITLVCTSNVVVDLWVF